MKSLTSPEFWRAYAALPPTAREAARKAYRLWRQHDDSWIPKEFKRGMTDAKAGRFVGMETVLSGAKPPRRRK